MPDQSSFLRNPQGVAVDAAGDIFTVDTGKNRLLKIAPDGTQTTVASELSLPQGVIADAAGNVFITNTGNTALLEVQTNGSIQTVWTNGATGSMAFDAAGDLYFPAMTSVERLSAASGAISPVAGTGEFTFGAAPGFTSGVEEISQASAVALDPAGSIYVADQSKAVIQRVSPRCALAVDGGATLRQPSGLAFDAKGNIYIADARQGVIWMGTPTPRARQRTTNAVFRANGNPERRARESCNTQRRAASAAHPSAHCTRPIATNSRRLHRAV